MLLETFVKRYRRFCVYVLC